MKQKYPILYSSALKHRLGMKYQVGHDGSTYEIDPRIVSAGYAWRIKHGEWEIHEYHAALEVFDPALPLIEGGAGFGVTSVRYNKLLNDSTKHLVIEPNYTSIRYTERQKFLNESNFQVLPGAIAYDKDFMVVSDPKYILGSYTLDELIGTEHIVPCFTMKQLTERFKTRCNVAIDIEGNEYDIIIQDLETLLLNVESLVIDWTPSELTGQQIAKCLNLLDEGGFRLKYMAGNVTGHKIYS